MKLKINTEIFIERSKHIHNNIYDYSISNYKNSKTKVNIICLLHGIFKQNPYTHMKGVGCPKCNGGIKIDTDEFIKRCIQKHGNKYDYSKSLYINSKTKIKVFCKIHGEFQISPDHHIQGKGCKKCFSEKARNLYKLDKQETINKLKKLHGDIYDYSHLEFDNINQKVKIICNTHGIFEQRLSCHLKGSKCYKCQFISNTEDFIRKSKEIHGNLYNYDNSVFVNHKTKIEIICMKHGSFFQHHFNHIKGKGCPKCKSSKGELIIQNYFKEKNINYKYQFAIGRFRIDFLIENKIAIEYNGEQHYTNCPIWTNKSNSNEDLIYSIYRDIKKSNLCLKNNIKLISIPYWDKNNIEIILEKIINNEEPDISPIPENIKENYNNYYQLALEIYNKEISNEQKKI